MPQNIRIELEFPMHVSPQLLYEYISTASGLSEWFADDVIIQGDCFEFHWEEAIEKAQILRRKYDEAIRMRWLIMPEDTYFEMQIRLDEITQDISLFITDFTIEDESFEELELFWNNAVANLKHAIGIV